MYVTGHRYRVPKDAESKFIDLQVAEAFRDAGCLRSLLLRPADGGDAWLDLMFTDSKEQAQEIERILEHDGRLGALYDEFLKVTRLRDSEIETREFEIALDIMK